MKKHILSIWSNGRMHYFFVSGRTNKDGRTRISQAAMSEAYKRSNIRRGHCIRVG